MSTPRVRPAPVRRAAQARPAPRVRPAPRALVELVRLPAALSVPGDVLVGAAAAGWPFGRRTVALVGSSTCLYWAGMALNDWADRQVDAVERPHRPIPSGRVAAGFALGLAGGLTVAGLAVAAAAGGRRALAVAVPLAGAVWTYDLGVRSFPAGPAVMAGARALDVLLGAGGHPAALPAAATVFAHTAVVTGLSAVEVSGGPAGARRARASLAGTAVVAGLSVAAARRPAAGDVPRRQGAGRLLGAAGDVPPRQGAGRLLGAGLLGSYAAVVGSAQLTAARDPQPATVQRAVGAGVLGLIPLQASLLAAGGAPRLAAGLAALWPLARRLSRRVSPT